MRENHIDKKNFPGEDSRRRELTVQMQHDDVLWRESFDEFLAMCELRLGRVPVLLDWHSGSRFANLRTGAEIVSPLPVYDGETLPYLTSTFDVVVVANPNTSQLAEALRVASLAVLTVPAPYASWSTPTSELSALWLEELPPKRLPATSVIIPSFNSARLLRGCLQHLDKTLPAQLDTEIVVVDDASSDGSWEMLQQLATCDGRIRPLRNETNMGFGDSCNRGAAEASGDVLFFLNQDTEPDSGWLPPLLRRLQSDSSIGAVGSMLIYPDGSLQEAGGVVFSDGSAANFGRGLSPEHALVSYAREVDYCSAAALGIWRPLFERLGGFDQRYRPAYYEDTDLCMRVWSGGLKVVFEPESRIVHLEGSVHGTDVSKGGKRHQVRNHKKFFKRWRKQLVDYPPPPSNYNMAVWYDLAAWQPPGSGRS